MCSPRAIVILGAVSAPLIGWLAGFDHAAVLGIFSGASTNTPSLGAATQTLSTLPGIAPDRLALPALAYAVTYPTAIVGIIGTLLLLKQIFRIDPAREAAEFAAKNRRQVEPLERRTLVVTNPNLEACASTRFPAASNRASPSPASATAMKRMAATDATVIHRDDRLAVVGTRAGLEQFERVVGRTQRRRPRPRGKRPHLPPRRRHRSRRARQDRRRTQPRRPLRRRRHARYPRRPRNVRRARPAPAIWRPDRRSSAARKISTKPPPPSATRSRNSTKRISSRSSSASSSASRSARCPSPFPGLPQPIRLGLAGGPLIVALILGRVGRIGRQVWHMPVNTNLAFREFGIALFFAAVGLGAGAKFFATVFSATGLQWLLAGACVTVLPLLLVGIFARVVLKMNFMDLSGLLAGSMTDPPALAFASNICRLRRADRRLRHRLSAHHPAAHPLRASARDYPFPMNCPTSRRSRASPPPAVTRSATMSASPSGSKSARSRDCSSNWPDRARNCSSIRNRRAPAS